MDIVTHALAGVVVGSSVFTIVGRDLVMEPSPNAVLIAACTGAVIPDLDGLFKFVSPFQDWKWHRVALHNLPALLPLSLLSAVTGFYFNQQVPFHILWIISGCAVISHFWLDWITNFGSAFLFPLSSKRFALHLHFLTDPFLGVGLLLFLIFQKPWLGFIWIGLNTLIALMFRRLTHYRVIQSIRENGMTEINAFIEPHHWSPYKWLAILPWKDGYLLSEATPFATGPWYQTCAGHSTTAAKVAGRHPLLNLFIKISKFPRYEDRIIEGQRMIVVEDIRWWVKPPYRPLAFSAKIDDFGNPGFPRESRKWDRGPDGAPCAMPWKRMDE